MHWLHVRGVAKVLCLLGILSCTSAALLAVSVAGSLAVWHLAVAGFVNGMVWAADNPFRRALIGKIAGPSRMGTAMSLDVGASVSSRLLGPMIGGMILAYTGLAVVFAVSVALYVPGLIGAMRLRDRPGRAAVKLESLRETLGAGFVAARASPRLAGALWLTVLFNLFGWPVLSMIPVIGQDRLGLAADGIGFLASMDGLGTLLGVAALTMVSRPALYGRLYVCGVVTFLAAVLLFALSTRPLAAGAALLVVGLGQSAFSVMQSTIVFVSAPVERRAQAMGLLTMCIGVGPLGFLWLGWMAERAGASQAVLTSAAAGLVALALSWPCWRACWSKA